MLQLQRTVGNRAALAAVGRARLLQREAKAERTGRRGSTLTFRVTATDAAAGQPTEPGGRRHRTGGDVAPIAPDPLRVE
jgi:hypothetical protein